MKFLLFISIALAAQTGAKLTQEDRVREENFLLRSANLDLRYKIAEYRKELDQLQAEYVKFNEGLCKRHGIPFDKCDIDKVSGEIREKKK